MREKKCKTGGLANYWNFCLFKTEYCTYGMIWYSWLNQASGSGTRIPDYCVSLSWGWAVLEWGAAPAKVGIIEEFKQHQCQHCLYIWYNIDIIFGLKYPPIWTISIIILHEYFTCHNHFPDKYLCTYKLPSPSLGWAPPTKQTAATHPAPIMDLKIYLLLSSILMVIIIINQWPKINDQVRLIF